MPESYVSMNRKMNYEVHKLRICCDLKVVGILTCMQGGYVKHGYFLCKWNSRWAGNQYERKDWDLRTEETVGRYNILRSPLVPSVRILLCKNDNNIPAINYY